MECNRTYMEVFNEKNLLLAWEETVQHRTHAGVDKVGIPEFDQNLLENIRRLLFEIDYGIYYVKPAEILYGKRKIGLLAIEDKIVANCLKSYLNQISQSYSIPNSYAYQKGKSIYGAIDYLQEQKKEYPYFYQCDIEEFFPSVSKELLAKKLKTYISDQKIYRLILQFIDINYYEDGKIGNGTGLLLGSPLSPVLSNLYLYELDCQFACTFPVYVRYSDDMLFAQKQAFTKKELEWMKEKLAGYKLKINRQKSKIIAPGERFIFLGNEFGTEQEETYKIYIGLETEEETEFVQKVGEKEEQEGKEEQKVIELKEEKRKTTWKDNIKKIIDQVSNEKIREELWQISEQSCKKEEAENRLVEQMLHYGLYLQLEHLLEQREQTQEEIEWEKRYQDLFLKEDYRIFQGSLDQRGLQEYTEQKAASREEIFAAVKQGSTIAISPEKDGKSDLFVLDLDMDKRILLEYGEDYEAVKKLKERLCTIAFTIQQMIQENGGYAYVEESGYKGYHIWMFFYERIEIEEFWKKIEIVLTKVYLPQGCHVERIPEFGEECIKLPFCRHLLTGRRTRFVAIQGEIADQNEWILQIVRNSWAVFLQGIQEGEKEEKEKTIEDKGGNRAMAETVEEKCSLIGAIVRKAQETHYLTHFERNALLYVYGHMGETGAWYLHRIMAKTINYSMEITQSFLDKKKEFPVSCDKLKKRFPQFACRECRFEEYPLFYPSPVIHAYRIDAVHVTKPDYVNKKERLVKVRECVEKNRVEELKRLLLELTEKRREIEQDLEVCRKEIEGYALGVGEQEEGLLEKSGLVVEDGGIYLRIL